MYLKTWKSVILIFFICLTATSSFSQAIIKGKVLIKEGESAVGALVSLVSLKDSTTTLDFTVTDNDGNWQLENNDGQVVLLKASYLGYQNYFSKISINGRDSIHSEIYLNVNPVLINEIEIVAKTMDFSQRGDTLRYQLKNRILGGNETLGDVLERLPGFEIDENHQISYNGKKIDKLLIEGKDILKDQHQMANEGINSEDLLAVDIISHYKDRKAMFGGKYSDKIALNIDLDNEGKSIWSGNLEGGAGHKKKYQAAYNIFGIGDNYGITFTGKGNNIGEAVITSADYMSLLSSKRLLNKLNQDGNIENLVPNSLLIPKDLISNNDRIFTTNFEYSSDQTQFNSSLTGGQLSRSSGSDFVRTYTGEELSFFGEYDNLDRIPYMINFQSNLQYQWKDLLFFEFDLPLSLLLNKNEQKWNGTINIEQSDVNRNKIESRFNLFPNVYFDFKINPKVHLKYVFSFSHDEISAGSEIRDIDNLFNTDFNILNQSVGVTKNFVNHDISIFRDNNTSRIGVDLLYSQQIQKYGVSTVPNVIDGFQGDDELKTNLNSIAPFWRYKTDKWLFNATAKLNMYDFGFNNGSSNEVLFNPEVSIRHNFEKFHFLVLSMAYRNSDIGITNISELNKIEDGQTIITGEGEIKSIPNYRTFTLGYFNFNTSSQTVFNVSLSASRASNVFSSDIVNQDRFAIIKSFVQPTQTNLNGQTLFSKRILNGKWKFRQKNFYRRSESTITQSGDSDLFTYQQFSSSLSLNSISSHFVTYKLGLEASVQNQFYQENKNINNNVHSIRLKGGITLYKHNWKVVNDLDFGYQNGKNIQLNNIVNWDIAISYSPKEKPYSVSLVGNNILNSGNQIQSLLSFNPVFIDRRTFTIFPRVFLIKCKYRI